MNKTSELEFNQTQGGGITADNSPKARFPSLNINTADGESEIQDQQTDFNKTSMASDIYLRSGLPAIEKRRKFIQQSPHEKIILSKHEKELKIKTN